MHLIGAATYAMWADFWPGAEGSFAPPMNEIPKVVFSDSLASAEWGPATIARGDLAAAVTRLKQERPDGYLLAQGGVRFARSLVATGLIDEYRLVVHPGHPGLGRAALHDAADHRAHEHHRLQPRGRRPRLRGASVVDRDRQPQTGRCHPAPAVIPHLRMQSPAESLLGQWDRRRSTRPQAAPVADRRDETTPSGSPCCLCKADAHHRVVVWRGRGRAIPTVALGSSSGGQPEERIVSEGLAQPNPVADV